MTARALRQTLRSIRYKPGWEIGADEAEGQACLYVSWLAISPRGRRWRRRPTRWTRLSPWFSIRRETAQAVVRRVWRMIGAIERHEQGEFFRYRGVRPHDPHQ